MRTLGVLGLCALALLTAHRVSVWRSDQTLWADAITTAPLKPRPWINFANAVMDTDPIGAEQALERADALAFQRSGWEQQHGLDLARANEAVLALRQGRRDDAAALLVVANQGAGYRDLPVSLALCRQWQFC